MPWLDVFSMAHVSAYLPAIDARPLLTGVIWLAGGATKDSKKPDKPSTVMVISLCKSSMLITALNLMALFLAGLVN